MILNIISRIAPDKDFFALYIETVAAIKDNLSYQFGLRFIGPIEAEDTYNKIILNAKSYNIVDQISFTGKALPYQIMSNADSDIYLNACIGDFVGYSSIECVQNSFTTVFVNVDAGNKTSSNNDSFCNNKVEFYKLLSELVNKRAETIIKIRRANEQLLESFLLNNTEKATLLDILKAKAW